MNEPSPEKPPILSQIIRKVFGRPLPLETETCRYILVSALDFFVTYVLLNYRGANREGTSIRFVE